MGKINIKGHYRRQIGKRKRKWVKAHTRRKPRKTRSDRGIKRS